MFTTWGDLSMMEQHRVRENLALLATRSRFMTGKSVGALVDSGEWKTRIYKIRLKDRGSPYEPDDYLVFTVVREVMFARELEA